MRGYNHIRTALVFCLFCAFIFAFWRVHMRAETINLGYQIGQLKKEEHKLIEKKTRLQHHLSILRTKQALEKNIEANKQTDISSKPSDKKSKQL